MVGSVPSALCMLVLMKIPGHTTKALDLAVHPHFTLRKETVAKLWNELRQVRVMQIRSNPNSGKSTLAALLASWVSESTNFTTEVAMFTCPEISTLQNHSQLQPHSHFVTILRELNVPKYFINSNNTRLLILDEV